MSGGNVEINKKRDGVSCKSENDCFSNQYCAIDEGLCMKEKNLEYQEPCTRNGGNFVMISDLITYRHVHIL